MKIRTDDEINAFKEAINEFIDSNLDLETKNKKLYNACISSTNDNIQGKEEYKNFVSLILDLLKRGKINLPYFDSNGIKVLNKLLLDEGFKIPESNYDYITNLYILNKNNPIKINSGIPRLDINENSEIYIYYCIYNLPYNQCIIKIFNDYFQLTFLDNNYGKTKEHVKFFNNGKIKYKSFDFDIEEKEFDNFNKFYNIMEKYNPSAINALNYIKGILNNE